jgi:histidyl-tRNA synthetase
MWAFKDKSQRNVTLIPEATAMLQQMYRAKWAKSLPKPVRLFYVQRCYRYERPQEGRYREFTQFGLEIMGPKPEAYVTEAVATLQAAIEASRVAAELDTDVKRGLSYYTRQGFEARCPELGAQQQIAGGGTYAEGTGWAIGVDRLVLALQKQGKE